MLVISSGEFRANLKSYLDKIDKGEQIVIQRGKLKSYRIVAVNKRDRIISLKENKI